MSYTAQVRPCAMQITYLIFLKMADERQKAGQETKVPKKYTWANLVKLDGDDLENQYRHTLESLGKQGGMLGTIFRKAQNKIEDEFNYIGCDVIHTICE